MKREKENINANPPCCLSIKQTANCLNVSYRTIQTWIETGKLPCIRLGHRTVRIDTRDIEIFMQNRKEIDEITTGFYKRDLR